MNKDVFTEEVKSFQDIYCREYMVEHYIVFNFDNESFSAVIKCIDFDGCKWDIPICINSLGDIGIDIGEGGLLHLNGTGFYCYLWHEAKSRVKEND